MSLLLLLRPAGSLIAAPVGNGAPVVSGSPRVSSPLTTSTGVWLNNPTSYAFQWQSATTIGGTYANIGGATAQAYTPVIGDLAKFLRCVVTATNSGGSATQTSNAVGPVLAASTTFTANLAAPRPAMIWEIDFAAGISGSIIPVWTDTTPYARDQVQVRRGRTNELNRMEAGTCDVPADNSDRRFEPEFAASPYYPNVTPMRGLRLRAVYAGVTYGLHRGYVQGWPLTWPGVKRGRAAVSSTDGYEFLNGVKLTQLFPFALTGQMINAILDAAHFPTALRAIDAGTETVLGIDARQASALDLIQTVADSEAGLFFFDGNGIATFHDRDHRIINTRSQTIQATFGDGSPASGELPYLVPSTDYDVTRIYNDVQVSSGLSVPTTIPAVDVASQGFYGPRTLPRSTLLNTDTAAYDQSVRLLRDNKDPHLRFPTLTLDPTRDARLWPVVLGLEISDKVRVIRRPYVGGAAITKDLWVESILHDLTLTGAFGWITTLGLSLSDPSTYWTLDSTTRSVLDSTTVLR